MEILQNLDLHNEDCFNVFPLIKEKSVNLFVLDLPYNQTACNWDQDIIPLDKMWEHIKRIMKPNGIIIHFCTAKFGYRLIHSNPKWFRYDLIWKKSRKVGFLSANKMPLRQHENLYVFSDACNDDLDISRNKDLRAYAQKVKDYIGLSLKQIDKDIGNQGIHHFYCITSSQFGIPTETNYNKLIELYKLDEMPEFIPYETLNKIWKEHNETTYNPQKTEGKPYNNGGCQNKSVYGDGQGFKGNKKGVTERHPTSIIDHENLYVFSNDINEDYNDLNISRNKDLRQYAQKVKDYIGKTKTEIVKDIGQAIDHFFRITSSQFGLPTETTYNKLIDLYKLDEMPEFIPYETLKGMVEKPPPKIETTYNPQKTEGTPYKSKEKIESKGIYFKENYKRTVTKDTTNRHPSSLIDYDGDSILIYKNPHKTIHRTQKPVELLEWLIKTYSNEGETVMDFTMGSGTAAIACLNTNRKFIGVEKDSKIYELAQNRIIEHLNI